MVHRLAALAALLACGCSSHSAGPSPISGQWVHVQLQAQGAAVPHAFQATVAFGQNSAKTLVCPTVPSAPTDSLRCADGGFDVFTSTATFDVTLRSSGNAFLWISVQPNADSTATLVLSPLAPAQINDDYATGFDGDACLETVQQLSLSSSTDAGLSYSVKFYIQDVKTQPKVYFLNTKKHPLHYDFAHDVLGVTASATEFAKNTYSGADRTAMGGTLIFYPSVHGSAKDPTPTIDAPWTLNFFPSDDLTPEQARLAHRLIEERITCLQWTGPGQRLVYLPAGTVQEQQASDDASAFLRRDIGWMNHTDLYGSLRLQALNPGLAFGTLKRMSPDELGKAVISFRDVLLLTRLPNELPIVGGTLTEEFQTPLAHCNIIAHTRGTPNLAYPKAFEDPSVAGLIGKLVRFEVKNGDFSLRETTVEEAEAFWNSRTGDPFVPVSDDSMTGIPSFADIGFADWIRVGTKAANLAELSHVLGENAPTGLAIPFHYYAAYMSTSQTSAQLCDDAQIDCAASARAPAACQSARDLCLPLGSAGETFFAFINRVLDNPTFKVDTGLRDAVLGDLRYFIVHTPVDPEFGNLLDNRIAEVFQNTKVRIRSSTNAEDLATFSGAGLYNSYGAYASGPDSADRMVLQVFASVWTFRGFEERSFWNIDHRTVRMGCAVHAAFTNERANGVLITENIADPTVYGMYVNVQRGNAAVTNPVGGALPEIFSMVEGPDGIQVARQRFSSLCPIPILSDSQIATLYQAATKARSHFAPLYGSSQLILDMEFKLTADDKIVFKQARPYRAAL